MNQHYLDKCLLLFLLSLQMVWGSDHVMFLNPPAEPVPGYSLKVLYSCSKPAVVLVECLVSYDTGVSSTVFQRHWSCEPGPDRIRTLLLSLPDWLVYQPDWVVPDTQWVLSGMLRASVSEQGSEDSYRSGQATAVVSLQPTSPLSRPMKQHQLCPGWATQMLWLTRRTTTSQCPVEQETVHLLSSMYASTGENFGITKTLNAYSNEVLEYLRLQDISFPWCVFSIWVFLTQSCQEKLCAVFHHIDYQNNYATPNLFLKRSVITCSAGQLHVQMHGETGRSSAFLCPFQVPLAQWCHINMELRGRMVDVTMVCIDGQQRLVHTAEHVFRDPIHLDDTEGYFVVSGGQFMRGIEGYYGPLVYYRNRIPNVRPSEVIVPDPIRILNLTGWLQSCQEFQLELHVKLTGYLLRAREKQESENCMDAYHEWTLKCHLAVTPHCEPWEAPNAPQRHYAVHLAKILATKHGGRKVDLASVGRALYSLSLRKLRQESTGSTGVVNKIMALLLQAGCLGNNRALHLSSVLYSSGMGVERQPNKAWLLSLLSAQKDWRLALLRLGHLHQLGEHGIPPDSDLAYAYYSNIAKQTSSDHHNPSPQQMFVESIYLNNEEVLSFQTNENHDIFHWLKLQARNGAADAEQAVARMLFWGQQGVSPDIQTAVRHYERGAVHLGDPVSMYDYAIVLIQGQGVKKDIPRAVTFLKKAVEQGFTPAINALGWYYEQFEKDYQRAVQLWEQADKQGSSDAAMNLGVMYSQGLYPGKAADKFMAYTYYLKSAQRGNIDGSIQLADVWTTGIPGRVKRRPADAVLWVKWAAERNGHLGMVLRKALDSYFKGDSLMALLYYMMAAESGFAAAQFNVAYLCEQNPGGFLDPTFAVQCMRRFYNLTSQAQDPDPYALIRMGDLLYEGHGQRPRDVAAAAEMYKQAALRSDPHGWYSLGVLVQEEQGLPLSVLSELGLTQHYMADNTELATTLYRRCRDSNSTAESYLPCSLALFHAYLQSFQKDYSATIKVSGTVVMAVAVPPILFIILRVLRGRGIMSYYH
ncbi:protein sel-1 homolog 3 isoform X1 [Oncorhynchus tshawytscha]|uniref:protein sel-1 homolog 3 isoform X1 n=1 Tax=Oncorhynchus tshawytscha TaxID=74940 RepID=UPI000D0A5A47|nr:protein sel-1 homolog 3 isoform X1 [Oncorhynchus tshawytscha]